MYGGQLRIRLHAFARLATPRPARCQRADAICRSQVQIRTWFLGGYSAPANNGLGTRAFRLAIASRFRGPEEGKAAPLLDLLPVIPGVQALQPYHAFSPIRSHRATGACPYSLPAAIPACASLCPEAPSALALWPDAAISSLAYYGATRVIRFRASPGPAPIAGSVRSYLYAPLFFAAVWNARFTLLCSITRAPRPRTRRAAINCTGRQSSNYPLARRACAHYARGQAWQGVRWQRTPGSPSWAAGCALHTHHA